MFEYVNVGYVKLTESAIEPKRAHKDDSGFDLFSDEAVTIEPGKFYMVSTGIAIEMPDIPGIEAQIRSRSGMAAKNGVFVLNSPGTVDKGYRGEIKVILANFGESDFDINPGDRVAQIVFAKNPSQPIFAMKKALSPSIRGDKGVGSTGK